MHTSNLTTQVNRIYMIINKTTPTKRDSGDGSGNPPVTQVATPLIMQNFKL